MPEWHKGFGTRAEILAHAFAHAMADAVVMKNVGQEATKRHMIDQYDIDLDDVEDCLNSFCRMYLDPQGLRSDESADEIDGDRGTMGAFFIGLLTGWGYANLNDHKFPDENDDDDAPLAS